MNKDFEVLQRLVAFPYDRASVRNSQAQYHNIFGKSKRIFDDKLFALSRRHQNIEDACNSIMVKFF
jgi:hypothetical protein